MLFNQTKSGSHFVDVNKSNFRHLLISVNDVLRDTNDIPYMVNIVKLIRTMLTL